MGDTTKEIYDRMASDLVYPASKMPGSFTADNLLAVANEMARILSEKYELLMDRAHISTATGIDLDTAARDNHGMLRKEASYEEVNLVITGVPGTVIDSSVSVEVDDTSFVITGNYVIGDDGKVEATARCTEIGAGHTVAAGSISKFTDSYTGLDTVTNPEASSGGYDKESDSDFVERIHESEQEVVGYGNIAWYRKTAREVAGVSKAKVFDLARGKGTVDVVIIADGNKEAGSVLVKRVFDHIEEGRVPGADVQVSSGTSKDIQVSAKVYLNSGYSISAVKEDFLKKFQEFINDLDFSDASVANRVSYAKVSDLLVNCEGVLDIDELLLNGQNTSIDLGGREFPVAVSPTLEKVT